MAIYSPSISLAEQPTLSPDEVMQVGKDIVGRECSVEPLTGGSNLDIFKIRGALGHGVLKFFPVGSRLAEFEAAGMRRASQAEVPAPAVLGEGSLDLESGKRPWIAMEYARGKPMSEMNMSATEQADVLKSVGRLVADLHLNSGDAPEGFWRQTDVDDQGKPVWKFASWHDYLGNMGETLQEKADTLSAAGLTTAEIDYLMKNITEYRDMSPDEAVFCHADLRLEHVGIDSDNKIVSVIDWGSAQANSPEREFSKPLTADDSPMINAYSDAMGYRKSDLNERVRRMQLAHLPALVIFNVEKNRPSDTQDRVADIRNLI